MDLCDLGAPVALAPPTLTLSCPLAGGGPGHTLLLRHSLAPLSPRSAHDLHLT